MESDLLAIRLLSQGKQLKEATVELSNELVPLLSEQLYRSPMKAIEELVVNSYDAAAKECRLFVPTPSAQLAETDPFMVVFDDGDGMEVEGLVDLWVVGRSPKRIGDRVYKNRKQIGKFGIGKIASYSVANRLTYVTKHDGGDILTSTLNFKDLVGGNSSEV